MGDNRIKLKDSHFFQKGFSILDLKSQQLTTCLPKKQKKNKTRLLECPKNPFGFAQHSAMVVDILSGLFTSQSCEQVWPAQKRASFTGLSLICVAAASTLPGPGLRVRLC